MSDSLRLVMKRALQWAQRLLTPAPTRDLVIKRVLLINRTAFGISGGDEVWISFRRRSGNFWPPGRPGLMLLEPRVLVPGAADVNQPVISVVAAIDDAPLKHGVAARADTAKRFGISNDHGVAGAVSAEPAGCVYETVVALHAAHLLDAVYEHRPRDAARPVLHRTGKPKEALEVYAAAPFGSSSVSSSCLISRLTST